ncbi:hypothetical protein D3C87_805110 [compost metagenome]
MLVQINGCCCSSENRLMVAAAPLKNEYSLVEVYGLKPRSFLATLVTSGPLSKENPDHKVNP